MRMGIFGSKEKITLSVEGMTCEHCEMRVRNALAEVDGVKKVVKVDRGASEAVVSVADKESVSKDALVQAVAEAGYTAKA